MKKITFSIILLLFTAIMACSDDNVEGTTASENLECNQIESKEEAQNLRLDLIGNRLTDVDMIKDKLIGTWGLIGVESFLRIEPDEECVQLSISRDEIVRLDISTGNIIVTDWELETTEINGSQIAYLKTNENLQDNGLGMTAFSENLMYGDGRVDDAPIFYYEKIE